MRSPGIVVVSLAVVLLFLLGALALPTLNPRAQPSSRAIAGLDGIPVSHAHPALPAGNGVYSLPCWALNQTICVGINETNSSGNDVVPFPPRLNANSTDYPPTGNTIYLDVYSVYDLQKNWGGGGGEFLGNTSYLYLSVTDVEWNGIPWFCSCDQSVWHANAGVNWAPAKAMVVTKTLTHVFYNPNTGPSPLSTHFLYHLQITGNATSVSGTPSPNFPSGSYVQWNVTSVHYGVNGVAYRNSTGSRMGGPFTYYVNDAWYWSPGSCLPYQPCYPNSPTPSSNNCPTNGMNPSAAAFRCNLGSSISPAGQPTVGSDILLTIQTNNTWQMYTGAQIQIATVYLSAYYPNGSFWMNWESGFTSTTHHFPTESASVTIPSSFFTNAYSSVSYYLVVYDQSSDELQSQNNTLVTSASGIFTGTNFTQNINLTTDPPSVGQESYRGTLNGTGYPAIPVQSSLNITIVTTNSNVTIQEASLVMKVNFSAASGTQTPTYPMKYITNTQFSLAVPSFPAGSNVTFYVKAMDRNETWVTSHLYHYFVPVVVTPPVDQGFFYVEVSDNATNTAVTGANVTIVGVAGVVDIHTTTMLGLAYPNISLEHFTPEFLPVNTTYAVTVNWTGFQPNPKQPADHQIMVTLYLTHIMSTTMTLKSGGNFIVQEKKDILYFAFNVPAPPPTFSAPHTTSLLYLKGGLGLTVATALIFPVFIMWRAQRRRAEEEEKRITL